MIKFKICIAKRFGFVKSEKNTHQSMGFSKQSVHLHTLLAECDLNENTRNNILSNIKRNSKNFGDVFKIHFRSKIVKTSNDDNLLVKYM